MPVATSPPLSSSPALPTLKRPQGILRGSSVESSHKKRPSSSLQDSQDTSSSKRQKVQFVSRPSVHVLRHEEIDKSVALVTAEVRNALTKHNEGEASSEYEELNQLFTAAEDDEDAPSTAYLAKCLVGLASNSNLLKRNSAGLVHSVLRMKWLHRDDDFYSKFQKFLTQLVGSQSGFVRAVLTMLVENFAHLSTSSSGVHRTAGLTRKALQDRVHSCIKFVIFMVPAASTTLCDVLSTTFPFITDTKRSHVEYVQNLLRLADSMPELRSFILDLVLERLVAIDVQVQIDIQDLEEDIGDVLIQNRQVRSSQLDDSTDASSSESSDDELDDPEAARIKSLRLLVAKMDAMLDLLFTSLHPLTKSHSDTSQQTFNHLLAHLQNTLLRTPSSRHTQFLLFTAAQTQTHYTQQYLDTALSILCDTTRPAILRVSAAAYAASFTARAKTLEPSTVLYVFHALARFTHAYRKQHESTARGPNLRLHAPYYAAVQACLYVFCFRWRDLLADADDLDEQDTDEDLLDAAARGELTFEPGVKDAFSATFTGKLNPLKVCAPSIVEEFASVAYALGFMYIYQILEANKRVRLLQPAGQGAAGGMRDTALTALSGERWHQLEGVFPFDPYALPVSRSWVGECYKEYEGCPGVQATAGQEEMSDGEDEVEDSEEGDEDSVATPEDD